VSRVLALEQRDDVRDELRDVVIQDEAACTRPRCTIMKAHLTACKIVQGAVNDSNLMTPILKIGTVQAHSHTC
jgi:hypothetical protein